jgi:hypothetical protein
MRAWVIFMSSTGPNKNIVNCSCAVSTERVYGNVWVPKRTIIDEKFYYNRDCELHYYYDFLFINCNN